MGAVRAHTHADGRRTEIADDNLWGVYLRGADEWHAANSMWDAMKTAQETNAAYWKQTQKDPSPNDPWFWAIPDVWPFTESAHKDALQKQAAER